MNKRTKRFTWRLQFPFRHYLQIHGGWFRHREDGHWFLEFAVLTRRRAR